MTFKPPHVCTHDEVVIGADDGPLIKGDKVLVPCRECGESPRDTLGMLDYRLVETERALTRLVLDKQMILYHWSPTRHRKQINRYGLVPHRKPVTHPANDWRAPYVCLADTAGWAWSLSGSQPSAESGMWDLWSVRVEFLTDPFIMPSSENNGIHEVRTHHRIYKRYLWLVGSREK
jgi:hypothetical protein